MCQVPAVVRRRRRSRGPYAGRLSLDALQVMRAAGFLPYDVNRPEEES